MPSAEISNLRGICNAGVCMIGKIFFRSLNWLHLRSLWDVSLLLLLSSFFSLIHREPVIYFDTIGQWNSCWFQGVSFYTSQLSVAIHSLGILPRPFFQVNEGNMLRHWQLIVLVQDRLSAQIPVNNFVIRRSSLHHTSYPCPNFLTKLYTYCTSYGQNGYHDQVISIYPKSKTS